MSLISEVIDRFRLELRGYERLEWAARMARRLAEAQRQVKANWQVHARFQAAPAGRAGGSAPNVGPMGGAVGAAAGSTRFGGAAMGGVAGAVGAAAGAVGGVAGLITSAVSAGTGAITGMVGAVGGLAAGVLTLVPAVGGVLSGITLMLTGVVQGIVGAIGSAINAIVGFVAKAAGEIAKWAGAIAGTIAGALATFIGMSVQAGAEMEALKLGLRAVAGTAEETEAQLKRLVEVAKLPGLGLQEAVRGSTRLQAAGLSAAQAEAALLAFGNAIATVGGGKEDLDGVFRALGQIAAKGRVFAEEINQINERIPQIRAMMKEAFGTSNTEELARMGIAADVFIDKVTRAMLKLPMVTGGAKNAFENLEDAWFRVRAAAGEVFNKAVVPIINSISDAFTRLVESGAMERLATGFTAMFSGINTGGVTTFLATVVAVIEQIPSIVVAIASTIRNVITAIAGWVQGMIGAIGRWLMKFGISQRGRWREGSLLDNIGKGAESMGRGMRDFSKDPMGGLRKLAGGSVGEFGDRIGKRRDEIVGMMAGVKSGASGDPAADALGRMGPEKGGGAAGALNEIARNTAQTARNTAPDLKRSALGGGDLGRIISVSEIQRIRGANNRPEVTINANDDDLRRLFQRWSVQLLTALNDGGRAKLRA